MRNKEIKDLLRRLRAPAAFCFSPLSARQVVIQTQKGEGGERLGPLTSVIKIKNTNQKNARDVKIFIRKPMV